MKKQKRRAKKYARNWKDYNEHLVRRGEMLLDLEFLDNWSKELGNMNKGKRGRGFDYPKSFIMFLAVFHFLFNLPLRQTEGFVSGLSRFIPKLEKPDHSTIGRRVSKMKPKLDNKTDEDIVIAVDSSGVKVTNRGDWMRHVWKAKRKKGYLKIHVAVDTKKKRILSMKVTTGKVGDSKNFKPLVEESNESGKVKKVLADGAYDSRGNFKLLDDNGIEAGIRVRKNSSLKRLGCRARQASVIEQKNYDKWKKKHGYGHRWDVECTFSSFKRMFGEFARSKKFYNMANEMILKAHIYNCLVGLTKFF